jgi:membrane protein YqaA with SNARE-associated domain
MRTTKAQLENQVEQINMLTNSPLTKYQTATVGNLISNIGHYYIGYAYGRSRLERIVNTGGGCSDISHSVTKRELSSILHSMLNVLENQKKG